MKTKEQLKPNYAPVYCAAMYPALCAVFHRQGYALAVHGSLARDFDLIAVPWTEEATTPEKVIAAISADGLGTRVIGDPERKPHGRLAYTLSVGFGECACDISFMPKSGIVRHKERTTACPECRKGGWPTKDGSNHCWRCGGTGRVRIDPPNKMLTVSGERKKGQTA